MRSSDASTVAEIASYMADNPSLELGLDSAMDPRNGSLGERRVIAVRRALMRAGVPADRIQVGAFGAPQNRRDGQVGVLLISANY